MDFKNNLIYYVPFTIFALVIYRNSLLPGGSLVLGKENILFLCIILLAILVSVDFYYLSKQNLLNITRFNFVIFVSFLILGLSTVLYNLQEIKKLNYLIRYLTFISYFIIFFILLPRHLNIFKTRFITLVFCIGAFSFIISLYGLFALTTGLNPQGAYHNYLHSILLHPNYAAPIFVFGAACTIYYYYNSRGEDFSLIKKVLILVAIFIQFLAILLTFSRNGIFAFSIFCIFFSLFVFRKKYIFFIPLFFISFPLFLLNFITAKGFGSLISRLYLLIPAYQMMIESKKRLIWGYGITDTFSVYSDYMILFNVIENDIQNPHNAFISAILMFGLIFVFVIAIFYLFLLYKGAKLSLKSRKSEEQLFYGFLVSVIITSIALGTFESQLVMTEYFTLQPFLIFSGILYLSIIKYDSSEQFYKIEKN